MILNETEKASERIKYSFTIKILSKPGIKRNWGGTSSIWKSIYKKSAAIIVNQQWMFFS